MHSYPFGSPLLEREVWVLILVVMDDALALLVLMEDALVLSAFVAHPLHPRLVLILVLMEDALVRLFNAP